MPSLNQVVEVLARNALAQQSWSPEDAVIVEEWIEDQQPVPEAKSASKTGGKS